MKKNLKLQSSLVNRRNIDEEKSSIIALYHFVEFKYIDVEHKILIPGKFWLLYKKW